MAAVIRLVSNEGELTAASTSPEGIASATALPRRPASRESNATCKGNERVKATSRPGRTGRSQTDSRPTMRPDALTSSSLMPATPRKRAS